MNDIYQIYDYVLRMARISGKTYQLSCQICSKYQKENTRVPFLENILINREIIGWSTYSNQYSSEVLLTLKCINDTSDSIMSSCTYIFSDPDFAKGQINIIMNKQDGFVLQFRVIFFEFFEESSRFVHVAFGDKKS